jgi:hypothetical protein
MGDDTERSLRRWKWIALVAMTSTGLLLAALVLVVVFLGRPAAQADERLIGTWQSDADRTVDSWRERRPMDKKAEADLRKLFGKVRLTFTNTTFTSELDGVTNSARYEVLARDKVSVVIRELDSHPLLRDMSEFVVLHFDGPDSFWLYPAGGIPECFKRVK